MNNDAKVTSIFATTRNGQAVMRPTAAALKRAEGIPAADTYPATHAMLDMEFNRHFGNQPNASTVETHAVAFHQLCLHQSQQIEMTRNHYRMYTIKQNIPDTVLACCLNFYAALEIPLGADKPLTATRSHAAHIHLIWDQQTEVRQKDMDSLDENGRFIFMDALAKRLDLFLDTSAQANPFDDARTSGMLHSIRKAKNIQFGDTLLARKIHENMPALDTKYRSFLRTSTTTRANIYPSINPQP